MSDHAEELAGDERAARFDHIMEWLVVSLLAFMPLSFGAVEGWSEQIVLALAGALGICFVLKLVLTSVAGVTWTWTYVPIVALLAIGVIQVLPLPQSLVHLISPNTAALKAELLADVPNGDEVLEHITVSFYPHGTWHDLRLLVAMAVVFVVVFNVCRREENVKRLLVAITIIGAGIALVALAQNVFGNNKIYWFVPSPHGVARSGPFVNHSHYGQFMNLSIGAALALTLVTLREAFVGREVRPDVVAEYFASPEAKRLWALVAFVVLGTSTVFLSMTRGGMVSTLVAGTLTALVLGVSGVTRKSGWIMALLALGAFICVLYIGFDAVYDRLGSLRDLRQAQGGRVQILKDVAVAWTKFPILGTGLGTHEVVYPMFDRSSVPEIASHAENEYAQAAEETGLLGLLALIGFGVLVGLHYFRATTYSHVPICSAAYGLGFGLMAILVHSLSDFGQHVPANAFLSVIFCALLIRLPRLGAGDGIGHRERRFAFRQANWYAKGGLAVVCIVFGWVLLEANAARCGEAHWKNVLRVERDLMQRDWQGSDDEYVSILAEAAKAQDRQPGNIKYRHWLNVYRWYSISRATDPNTGELMLTPEIVAFVERMAEELNQARLLCPTFGATLCVLGQLEQSVLGRREEGARHIRKGVTLAPCDATARFVAGTLEAQEGHVETAFVHFQKATELDKRLFEEVASMLITELNCPDLALRLSQDDARRLAYIATVLESTEGGAVAAGEVQEQVMQHLEEMCRQPDAPADALGRLARIYRTRYRCEEAIECYRRALASNHGQVRWRLDLAHLLAEAGELEEAIRHANICLRLRPEFLEARQFLDSLVTGT